MCVCVGVGVGVGVEGTKKAPLRTLEPFSPAALFSSPTALFLSSPRFAVLTSIIFLFLLYKANERPLNLAPSTSFPSVARWPTTNGRRRSSNPSSHQSPVHLQDPSPGKSPLSPAHPARNGRIIIRSPCSTTAPVTPVASGIPNPEKTGDWRLRSERGEGKSDESD